MSTFGENYSKYYNLLYKDKNYKDEVDYINELIKKYSKKNSKTLLDIGCGTGKHLQFFKKNGYTVSGVDLSENMIAEAKVLLNQENDFYCSKASEFKIDRKFDVVISLFHVMSYQIENSELELVFRNVYNHLEEGGVFIFDFWYGPGVLTDPPVVKIKRLEDDYVKIIRLTEPVIRPNYNTVDVNFEVLIEDKQNHNLNVIIETHKMRYLFLPEIQQYAENANLKFKIALDWMGTGNLKPDSWYGLVILNR